MMAIVYGMLSLWWMRSTQDIFGDTVRGGYGAEDDDEWVTVPVNLIPGQMDNFEDGKIDEDNEN